MNEQPDRVLSLLENSGVAVRPLASPPAPVVPSAHGSWSYGAASGRLHLHIYELDGQGSLDGALPGLEEAARSTGKEVSFAQNGGYLLALMFDGGEVKADSGLESVMDTLLAAFSGEE